MSRVPLSRPAIVGAAITLVDREGPGALSMRRLAAELGVSTMALYHYTADRAQLIEAIAAEVMSELAQPGPDPYWKVPVGTVARSFREVANRHPGAFPLLLDNRSAAAFEARSDVLATLDASGLDRRSAQLVLAVVVRFLIGWCLAETRSARARDDALFHRGLDAVLTGLDHSLADGTPLAPPVAGVAAVPT
jgi:AcrR family transcriptional regulator